MNPLEIISVVVSVMVILKLLVFLIRPNWLVEMSKKFQANTKNAVWFVLVLIAVIGYYTFNSLTVTQIFPAFILGHMVLALLLIQYPKAYKAFVTEMFKDTSKTWLVWLIWLGVSVWVLYAAYM